LLPESIDAVFAPASLAGPDAYAIEFECTLSDSGQQPGQAQLYLKGSEIFIAPNFERLSDGLAARTRRELIALTFPPGALAPGFYRLTLLGQTASKAWSLQVH
jgi:hypothetical protein